MTSSPTEKERAGSGFNRDKRLESDAEIQEKESEQDVLTPRLKKRSLRKRTTSSDLSITPEEPNERQKQTDVPASTDNTVVHRRKQTNLEHPEFSENERFFEVAIGLLIVPMLVIDYAFVGFNDGDTLFIVDLWDMVVTTLYLRNKNEFAFGWTSNFFSFSPKLFSYFVSSDENNEIASRILALIYSFFSSYFFYRINGSATKAVVMGNVSFLYDFWFDFETLRIFLFFAFIPVYFSPNDILYRMLHRTPNKTHRVIGDATWAVSKLDSLKRVYHRFNYRFSKPLVIQGTLGMIFTVFNCYASSILKSVEINLGKNSGVFNWPTFENDIRELLKSVSFKATLFCCLMLNLRFYFTNSHWFGMIILGLDVLALFGIFYRYSNDAIWEFGRSDLESFFTLPTNRDLKIKTS